MGLFGVYDCIRGWLSLMKIIRLVFYVACLFYFYSIAVVFSNGMGVSADSNFWLVWLFIYVLIFSTGFNMINVGEKKYNQGVNHGTIGVQLFICLTFYFWGIEPKSFIKIWLVFSILTIYNFGALDLWRDFTHPSHNYFRKSINEGTISKDNVANGAIFYFMVLIISVACYLLPVLHAAGRKP